MIFQKSQLAVAVALAISLSAQAQINNHGSITIDGSASIDSANAATDTQDFVNETFPINEVFEKAPSGPSSVYHGEGEPLLEIRDGTLNMLDMDLQDIDPNMEEFLSTGSESTFVIDKITSAQTFIETNGAHIEHNGSASAIEFSNSTLTGVAFDELEPDDESFPELLQGHKELLTNNGGEIISDDFYDSETGSYFHGGNAIDIGKSNIDGLIINEDWGNEAENAMQGGLIASTDGAAISVRDSEWKGGVINGSRHDAAVIAGQRAAIELHDTVFEGAIINEALGDDPAIHPIISGEERAILVAGGSFKGNIENEGLLEVGDSHGYDENTPGVGAIVLSETRFEGDIVNSGKISQEDQFGYKDAILAERTQVIGNIINQGQIQGTIVVDGSKHGSADTNDQSTWATTSGHGAMKGDIINTGQIQAEAYRGAVDIYGADLDGSIVNQGTIDSTSEGIRLSGGDISQHSVNEFYESTDSSQTGLVKGNILNQQGASIHSSNEGIELVSVNLSGNIENAGTISTDNGNGIAVYGGFERSSKGSRRNSIDLLEKNTLTTINGHIINHKTGSIDVKNLGYDDISAIYLENVALNGNIENHGSLSTAGSGIEIIGGHNAQEEVTWENTDPNSLSIHKGQWQTQTSKLSGNIVNAGKIQAGEHGVIIDESAELVGSIINSGSIEGGDSGIILAGGYKETGTYTIRDISGPDEWTWEEDRSQMETTLLPSAFNGGIINDGTIQSQGAGIVLANLNAKGTVDNSGIIHGDEVGIHIADDVTGSLTINQLAGELSGATALRMNQATRTNYTGGQLKGDVANHGGTFYVEGNRVIEGDYMQTAGSTLAMGLHKETSLAADNINLAEGSKVLIDLSKGDLYVQNGQKVELLKVYTDGKITDAKVDYVVSSNLVKVASVERNDQGNLLLTFDRISFVEQADQHESEGKLNRQQAQNVKALASALQKLDTLAQSNQAVAQLLNSLDGSPESFTALLPDVSGASVASAMNASNQAGTQVSVRARGLASGDLLDNSGMWIQALASNGEQDNRHGDAYKTDSRGFVLGADTELNNGLVLGAAYSFINTESDTRNSSTESDYHMATLYAAQALGLILLDGQAYYAWGDNDSRRSIGANASYNSSLVGARVGAGYQLELDQTTRFVPSLSLETARLSVDGYTESGSPGALTIGSQDVDRLELGLSTELSRDYQVSGIMVTPSLSLGAFHDFEAEAQASTTAFAAAPAETFIVTGRAPEKNRYVAGVGVELMSGENLTISAEYNYNWNTDGFDTNAGALKFRLDF